jgi:hypothetical protein
VLYTVSLKLERAQLELPSTDVPVSAASPSPEMMSLVNILTRSSATILFCAIAYSVSFVWSAVADVWAMAKSGTRW